MAVFEIPLSPTPQTFDISLAGASYGVVVRYVDEEEGGWVIDLIDAAQDTPIIRGIPLVTGADLLAQYIYLGIPGSLVVRTDNDFDAVPTFENLGAQSHLYFVTT